MRTTLFSGAGPPHGGEHVIQLSNARAAAAPAAEDPQHGALDRWSRFKAELLTFCYASLGSCVFLAIFLGLVRIANWFDQPPEYSIAVAGLDAAAASATPPHSVYVAGGGNASLAVPALFNLTVRINNPSWMKQDCLGSGATASVWYNGTHIAEGDVPQFCAGKRGEGEVAGVPVWGVVMLDAPMLWLPSPREMQRRGAAVDVAVGRPARSICSGVKVGGGMSLCSSEEN